jgi:predicted transport protein
MDALVNLLQQLQSKLDRFRRDGLKETPTRTIFVDPILEALGWDVRDPDDVQLEYPTIDGKSVDYALKINGKPLLLVEAKGMNDSLGDVKDITQTTGYAANDGIVWCILTNGVRWRVYRSIEQCPAPEKLMYEVSYDPVDLDGMSLEQVADKFRRFSRDQMAQGTLDALGEQTFTDGKVRKALQLLTTDAPKALLRLVRDNSGDTTLRPQAVKESLARILSPLLASGARVSPKARDRIAPTRRTAALKSWATRKASRDSTYTEEVHTSGKPSEVLEIYHSLDQFCLGLRPGSVVKRHLKKYIAYCEGKRAFCSVHLQQAGMRVWLKLKYTELHDPPVFARDVSNVGHWGVGDLELQITNADQLAKATALVRQSFEST